jgi:hypothetical protein
MRKAFLLSVVLGVAAAAPVRRHPRDPAGRPTSRHRTIHHRATFAKATALAVPSPVLSRPAPRETDGLSRNDDDCNYGCIDH